MNDSYQDGQAAQKYLKFLESKNGKIQQSVLIDALLNALPQNRQQKILDACCGSGWLTSRLLQDFPETSGFDSSKELIAFAQKKYPNINFSIADAANNLPYEKDFFDVVILNMAAPDLENLHQSFQNLSAILKNNGRFTMTIPNPYYTYPVAVWKRSFADFIQFKKPSLKIQLPYFQAQAIEREFGKGNKISSHFYPLSSYLNAAKDAGLKLKEIKEIKSVIDSQKFDLQYQLYRYPLILLVEFTK